MNSRAYRQPPCGFCDGTGLWADPVSDAPTTDPCPLCEGAGVVSAARAASEDAPASEELTLARILAALPSLTATERQRLYEELHTIYDCRIYRG